MFKKIVFVLFFISSFASAQEIIKGIVTDEKKQPLFGANIAWQNSTSGTKTDENGNFSIEKSTEVSVLEISYEGFETQKIIVSSVENLSIILKEVNNLKEVTISKTKKSTEHSLYKVANVQTMEQKELLKAACCNLSESFSTNPSSFISFLICLVLP